MKIDYSNSRKIPYPKRPAPDQACNQAEGSPPHTAALPVLAVAWPSWILKSAGRILTDIQIL